MPAKWIAILLIAPSGGLGTWIAVQGNVSTGSAPERGSGPGEQLRMRAAEFDRLLETVAKGWNEGNARTAADCFDENAIYSAPPGPNIRKGRNTLYEFFGGAKGREAPMSMKWHHLAFSERSQIGFGEYTFRYKDYQGHGIVIVRTSSGKISNWREYEMQSDLTWEAFVGANSF
jgi:hypothetical protein